MDKEAPANDVKKENGANDAQEGWNLFTREAKVLAQCAHISPDGSTCK
jgi:hypothetical protein